jgi:hypothetical protein
LAPCGENGGGVWTGRAGDDGCHQRCIVSRVARAGEPPHGLVNNAGYVLIGTGETSLPNALAFETNVWRIAHD